MAQDLFDTKRVGHDPAGQLDAEPAVPLRATDSFDAVRRFGRQASEVLAAPNQSW